MRLDEDGHAISRQISYRYFGPTGTMVVPRTAETHYRWRQWVEAAYAFFGVPVPYDKSTERARKRVVAPPHARAPVPR